jgi:transcriptional regulator with GAF, ATPase, and Fis domain
LFESELFGYRKGAFSAASQDRSGIIREADKGTLFLDEIGELPLASQVKLLRVLQEQEVLPLGAARPIPVDIKFCAATNRKLRDLVERKQFRDDLFARISGFQLQLPPLRHRREDLGLLIRTILGRLLGERARSFHLSRAAAAAMFQYHWPLNIRELESCLTTAFTLVKGDLIGIEHLPEKIRASINPLPPPGKLTVPSEEDEHFNLLREKLVALMISHDGNISAVARALGRDRVQVRRWLRKLNLEPSRFRSA